VSLFHSFARHPESDVLASDAWLNNPHCGSPSAEDVDSLFDAVCLLGREMLMVDFELRGLATARFVCRRKQSWRKNLGGEGGGTTG
jgi:hypothetical protein